MLANTRRNAGLGNPPIPFYTNVPESANAIIKRAVNFKESEMANFTLKMAQLIKRQREDVRGALLNSGPYKLDSEYLNFQLTSEKWFSMSTTQRNAYEKRFYDEFKPNEEIQDETKRTCSLSVRPDRRRKFEFSAS
jgi:hypothetical protein